MKPYIETRLEEFQKEGQRLRNLYLTGRAPMAHDWIKDFLRATITDVVGMMELEEAGKGYPLPEDFFAGKSKAECARDGYNSAVGDLNAKVREIMG